MIFVDSDAQVTADFSADKTEGCSPLTVQFKNQSTGKNLRYLWSFGNGNISTLEHAQAIYYQPGAYEVSLTVTDSAGNKDSKVETAYITVFRNPEAAFSGGTLNGCTPLSTTMTDQSKPGDGKINQWIWDFGDGNTLNDSVGKHVYKSAGIYNVSLLVIDVNNCQNKTIIQDHVSVLASAEINFEADKEYYCKPPLTVNFTDLSTKISSSDTYYWDFGDGNTSTAKNPTHTYTKKGTFDVSLAITKPTGCNDTLNMPSYIVIGDLMPNFVADKRQICNMETVNFDNKTTPSLKGVAFKWDFGDGGSGLGVKAKHQYTKPGTYSISLVATVDNGCSHNLTVKDYITVYALPVSDFKISDTFSCIVPKTITLESISQNTSSVDWQIDSTSFSKDFLTSSTFKSYGEYLISLIAKNEAGCIDQKDTFVRLKNIKADIDASIVKGCTPLEVMFYDKSTPFDPIVSKTWNLGGIDVSDANVDSIGFTFTEPGIYKVILDIFSEMGCQDSDTITISVGEKSKPSITLNFTEICNATYIELRGNALPMAINYYEWQIGKDGKYIKFDSANLDTFNNKFDTDTIYSNPFMDFDAGYYDILFVTENNGCMDSVLLKDSLLILAPNAVLIYDAPDLCSRDDTVTFWDRSTNADSTIFIILNPEGDFVKYSHDSILQLGKEYKMHQVLLQAFNFETNCVETEWKIVSFPNNRVSAEFIYDGNLCAPSTIHLSARGEIDNIYNWTSEVDTLEGRQQIMVFEKPGTYRVKLRAKSIYTGCVDTSSQSFTVKGPKVEAELESSGPCLPVNLELKTLSDPANYTSLYWLIDDEKIVPDSGKTLIKHSLLKPSEKEDGSYLVRFIGIDSNGCQGIEDFPVKVDGLLNAELKLRRFSSCAGNKFIFELDAPDYDIKDLKLSWDFGDGTGGEKAIENKTFQGMGPFKVSLKVEEPNGCITEFNELIDIERERLYADFVADSLSTDCPPLFVQFKDLSLSQSRSIEKWYWDFGDGSGSTEKNPSKLYLKAGQYTVKLNIVDEWGCEDSVIVKDLILVNGPEGYYSFDNNRGCVPLEVNFNATTTGASELEWDMGDGNVIKDKHKLSHTYTQAGRYIPLLILKDSFGCSYTLPPIDTIEVNPYPEPDFSYEGACYGSPITFNASEGVPGISIDTYLWEFKQGSNIDTSNKAEPVYVFSKGDVPSAKLTVISDAGCAKSIEKALQLYKLDANFKVLNEHNCVGTILDLINTSKSDLPVRAVSWIIENEVYTGDTVQFLPLENGKYSIGMQVENVIGCSAVVYTDKVIVGDTLPPSAPEILRVTVVDDHSIQLDYKESTMNDFNAYLIYKHTDEGYQLVKEEYNALKNTFIEQGLNTLDNIYCYKAAIRNSCGLVSDTVNFNPHCTVNIEATEGLNYALVDWSPYIGWENIKQYDLYRENKNVEGEFEYLATVPGNVHSYTDSSIYCHIIHRYKVSATEEAGNMQISYSDTCAAKPEWESTLTANELVRASVVDDLDIIVEWDSVSAPRVSIMEYVLEKSRDGVRYQLFNKWKPDEFEGMDAKVFVDDYSYFYRSYAIDECGDTSPYSNFGKTILLKADSTADQRPFLTWSTYRGWEEGVDYYTVEIENPDGSFTEIGANAHIDTGFTDLHTPLNQRPEYCYRIIGHRVQSNNKAKVISISNVDCSPIRSSIFVPNAFTPDNNGLNDKFVTPGIYIADYHITIYNRWGEIVFESFDYYDNWDGTYLGKPCQQDAYAVIVETVGVDRIRRTHAATVTLLR